MSPRASSLPPLVQALRRREFALDDWGARATDGLVAWRRRDGVEVRAGGQELRQYRALVHRDQPGGRGSALLDVDAGAPLYELVGEAVERALATIGPAWRSPPAAAPARVAVADPAIGDDRLDDVADQLDQTIAAAARAAGAELAIVELEVVRQTVTLATSRGLEAAWPETELDLRLELIRGGRSASVRRRARRLVDLEVAPAIAAALAQADRMAAAEPTPTGRVAIVLEAAALLHGGLGLLAAFVGQADPGLERQGLVAARLQRPIVAGAATTAEPLTLTSDGTLPYGLASAPVGDTGDPIRRFALVERGMVAGLALDGREAALRGAQANGGVRGLVVPAGATDGAALVAGPDPTLEVLALRWLELEPMTGRFRARIALGRLHLGGGGGSVRDVRDGLIGGDALAALALARRSREVIATPSYRGPTWWALGELIVT